MIRLLPRLHRLLDPATLALACALAGVAAASLPHVYGARHHG